MQKGPTRASAAHRPLACRRPDAVYTAATMLDARKEAILRAVVSEYIETAQPVGSAHIANAPGVNVSSATVRNEMSALEQLGFLHQPYTSAGRIPTDLGYRFFVDSMGEPGKLATGQAHTVRRFFDDAHGELEAMLRDTSRLLSNLTNHAAVVIGPGVDRAEVRSVQLVGLAPQIVLAVVVLANGAVEKQTLELVADVSEDDIASASLELSAHLVGKTLASLSTVTAGSSSPMSDLVQATIDAFALPAESDAVFVDGQARVADSFEAVEQVRQVLSILESQLVVVSLIRDVLDRGASVAIGNETGVETLADCSLVVAQYTIEGEDAGTIGVLGPTRMDYGQALAAVGVVSNRLGRSLS